jgi:hypothetical protein
MCTSGESQGQFKATIQKEVYITIMKMYYHLQMTVAPELTQSLDGGFNNYEL